MVKERRNGTKNVEMGWIDQMMRGLGEDVPPSCFVDAEDLQESSEEDWLSIDNVPKRDYTKFGRMKKLSF